MAVTSSDIIRRAGDTYPTKSVIKINGVPIDITGWEVEVRYKTSNGTKVIDCIKNDAKNGKVLIYPHARDEGADKLSTKDYISNDMVGKDIPNTSPVRQYEQADVNQVWDEDEENKEYPFYIVRWKKFDNYIEEHTHNVGTIRLLSRWR